MKNFIVLIVMTLLQIVSSPSYACELKIVDQSSIDQFTIDLGQTTLATLDFASEQDKKNATGSSSSQNDGYDICLHPMTVASLTKIEFNFISKDFFLSPLAYHFIYQQPFLSFSKKPPIHS